MRHPRVSTAHVAFTVLVMAMAFASASCRTQTAGEEIRSRIRSTPPPSSSGSCHFDLNGLKEVTVFRTLGMLEEYLGRPIVEDGDLVEHFYKNDREPHAAEAFRRVTTQLAEEQQMRPRIPPTTSTFDLGPWRSG